MELEKAILEKVNIFNVCDSHTPFQYGQKFYLKLISRGEIVAGKLKSLVIPFTSQGIMIKFDTPYGEIDNNDSNFDVYKTLDDAKLECNKVLFDFCNGDKAQILRKANFQVQYVAHSGYETSIFYFENNRINQLNISIDGSHNFVYKDGNGKMCVSCQPYFKYDCLNHKLYFLKPNNVSKDWYFDKQTCAACANYKVVDFDDDCPKEVTDTNKLFSVSLDLTQQQLLQLQNMIDGLQVTII